jgi:hypothetical protein
MLTSGTKSHHLKHETKDSRVKDYRNFVALINPESKDAFTIEQGDRRFAMIEGGDKYSKKALDENKISAHERKAYFVELWKAVEDDASVQWLARYLVYDVYLGGGWTPEDIPTTRVRTEQQELNICPVHRFLLVWKAQSTQTVGEANDCDLFYQDKHQNQDGEWLDCTYALESWHPGNQKQYKAMNLHDAFVGWCKRTGASTSGASNLNAFGQKLSRHLYEETKNPHGILHKKSTKRGVRYWMARSLSSN